MTRDQLEELVERLEHGAKPERYEDFAAADYPQLCGEATTLLRSMLAQEPVAWMYAPKDCSIRPTPWAKDMPRVDGIELVRLIRADRRFATLPVMIVSYKDREADRLRGLDAGASYYLPKASFQDDTFLKAVDELIGHAEGA